jgi:hypothetical protein
VSAREVVIEAGNWLYVRLVEAGADGALAKRICTATGQRQAMLDSGEDPWPVARQALVRFERGEWDDVARTHGQLMDAVNRLLLASQSVAEAWGNYDKSARPPRMRSVKQHAINAICELNEVVERIGDDA